MAVLLATALLLPMAGYPQTLDDAVREQLEINPAALNFACERLLNGNPTERAELAGGLNSICGRSVATPGTAPANSTGGGNATPITLPSIMQQRLREARGKDKKAGAIPKSGGARLDYVAKPGRRLSFFISGGFDGLDRNVTTFENGDDSDIRRVTANADGRVTDRTGRRPEEKRFRISKVSQNGSSTLSMGRQQPGPVDPERRRAAMAVNDDATYRTHAAAETAAGRLPIGAAVAKADQAAPPELAPVTAKGPQHGTAASLLSTGPEAPFRRGAGLWGTGGYEHLDRDATTFEDGYDSGIWRVTVGADYQFTDRILAGLAFDYYQQDGHFDRGGEFDVKSLGLIGFGSFLPAGDTFIQFYGGYARNEYDRTRITIFTQFSGGLFSRSGAPYAGYDANQYRAGILGGYDVSIGNVTIGPGVGLDWIHTDFEAYGEEGDSGLELTFHDDDQTLLQTRAGVRARISFRTDFGVIVPQASFDWKHEFANDQRTVEVSFVDDTRAQRFTYETGKPDRDWFEINAGVAAALANGVRLFGNYRTMVGHSFFNRHAGTIGLRFPF